MGEKNVFRIVSFFICLTLVYFSCEEGENKDNDNYQYIVPEMIGDGWETASLAEVGIDQQGIEDFINYLIDNSTYLKVHGFLLVKEGKLVVEEYFSGYSRLIKHEVRSASKSFRSALIGIAIANGFIASVNEKLFDFFPDYAHLNNTEKEQILLKHVLTMSSGFSWNEEDVPFPDNDLGILYGSDDRIQYVLSKPMAATPGSNYYYNTGATFLLTDIITRTTGLPADLFADIYLYKPMQMQAHAGLSTEYPLGDGMLPRDMAKFGQLFLFNGKWQGQQIIPVAWVKESTRSHMNPGWGPTRWKNQYGYLWWTGTESINGIEVLAYFAWGGGGQLIGVFPQLATVAIFTGDTTNHSQPFQLLRDRVIPVILSLSKSDGI